MSKKSRHITIALLVLSLIIITISAIVINGFFTKENRKREIQEQANILKDMPEEKTSQIGEVKEENTKKIAEISVPKENTEKVNTKKEVKNDTKNVTKKNTTNLKSNTSNEKSNQSKEISSRSGSVKTNKNTVNTTKKTTVTKTQNTKKSTNKTSTNNDANNGLSSKYKGHTTIGRIQIPKTGVNLYILKNQTVEGMEIASCLIYNTGELNKSGNNVIVAHNYRNGKLFSNNNKLKVGDKIYITTLDGKKVTYTIYKKFVTTPEDVSFYKRETNGPEITLSTCSNDEKTRIIILAK